MPRKPKAKATVKTRETGKERETVRTEDADVIDRRRAVPQDPTVILLSLVLLVSQSSSSVV